MKTLLTFLLLLLTTSALFSQTVLVASIDGTINPAASAYVQRVVEQAREMNAECLVIRLNTPGGLLKSTRVIVSELLESLDVPRLDPAPATGPERLRGVARRRSTPAPRPSGSVPRRSHRAAEDL